MTTKQAPTLFGKEMSATATGYEWEVAPGLRLHIVESITGRWFIRFPGFDGAGTTWATAHDAAKIAEHHLSNLRNAFVKLARE